LGPPGKKKREKREKGREKREEEILGDVMGGSAPMGGKITCSLGKKYKNVKTAQSQ